MKCVQIISNIFKWLLEFVLSYSLWDIADTIAVADSIIWVETDTESSTGIHPLTSFAADQSDVIQRLDTFCSCNTKYTHDVCEETHGHNTWQDTVTTTKLTFRIGYDQL